MRLEKHDHANVVTIAQSLGGKQVLLIQVGGRLRK
jgi:hypothetical protein